jgi:glycosyltransferase involved in cell wall biosynthesis
MLSVIIPASNEAAQIGGCLDALLGQQDAPPELDVVVAANGCRDATAAIARGFAPAFAARGWSLTVLDVPEGGKPGALNRGDAAARHPARAYLDADVRCGPGLLGRLAAALDTPAPRYATGRLTVAPSQSWVTRHYAAIWTRLPFMVPGTAPGAGLFAVNPAGRARWGDFPPIISDDTYVRLLFAPAERIEVDAPYLWPLPEGARNLLRVRRRQDAGVAEVLRLWPQLAANRGGAAPGPGLAARLVTGDPLGFALYSGIVLAARQTRGSGEAWARGR